MATTVNPDRDPDDPLPTSIPTASCQFYDQMVEELATHARQWLGTSSSQSGLFFTVEELDTLLIKNRHDGKNDCDIVKLLQTKTENKTKTEDINRGEEMRSSKIEPDKEEEPRQSTTKPEKTNDKKKGLLSIFKYYTETNQFNGYAEVETPTSEAEVCWVCFDVFKRTDVIIRSGCGCNKWVHARCLTQQYDACNNERNRILYHGKIGIESEFLKQCGLCREYLIGSEQAEVRYVHAIQALRVFETFKKIKKQMCWMDWLPKIIKSFLERIMSINIHWRSQGRKLK